MQKEYSQHIGDLEPASKWSILIDDTGSIFKNIKGERKDGPLGKLVALLIPNYEELPPLPIGWHATELRYETGNITSVLRNICMHQCGIVGISVENLPSMQGDLWSLCILRLAELIFLMLPVDEYTSLRFYIEEHSEFTPEMSSTFKQMCNSAKMYLAKFLPEKARKINFDVRLIKKEDDPRNGYVDAIAYTWGQPFPEARKYLKKWIGPCLWEGHSSELIDFMLRMAYPGIEDWNKFLISFRKDAKNRYIERYLVEIKKGLKNDPKEWTRYLDAVREHLESKNIDLALLDEQLLFLKESRPVDLERNAERKLTFMTCELAHENHHGFTIDPGFLTEFSPLCEELFEQNPSLVAWADLNLSIAYTNTLDFAGAERVMHPWEKQQITVPGRQYHGQILSTLGQIQAFQGNQKGAISYFDKALDELVKNTDPDKAELDKAQTLTYKVIASMDSEDIDRNTLLTLLQDYLDLDLPRAAICFSQKKDDPYSHHVFLRALATGLSPESEQIYLQNKGKWKTGNSHPWELIEFYRGILLTEPSEKLAHWRKGYDIAKTGHGILLVIAAMILGSILTIDDSVACEYTTLLRKLQKECPNLGERENILISQVVSHRSPLELAKLVLPFNFR